MKGTPIRPQEFFRPRHLLLPVETAAALLGVTVLELERWIASGKNPQFVLVELPGGRHVEFKSEEGSKA